MNNAQRDKPIRRLEELLVATRGEVQRLEVRVTELERTERLEGASLGGEAIERP